jgi:uncharacterized membrane protein
MKSYRAFIAKQIQDIQASYWFLPATLVILAILLAEAMLYLDRNAEWLVKLLPETLRDTQVDGARALMGIISQSVFGVAGVMFSMTIVAVSFAAGNFGPRLIGNFMRDRGNQRSLGILVSTFVYALFVARAIQGEQPGGALQDSVLFVPHLAITLAFLLTLVSVLTVIYFVHHIPEIINVSNITADIGKRLIRDLKALIDDQAEERKDETEKVTPIPSRDPDTELALKQCGYIQTLDKSRLEQLAEQNDWVIDVPVPHGEFINEDSAILKIWGPEVPDDLVPELRGCFALGENPSDTQNLFFMVDQLVEMIARALSPGINDPFTAINCLNWLHAAVVVAANHNGGLAGRSGGPVRTIPATFQRLLDTGFGASFPYVKDDPLCDKHLRSVLSRCRDEISDSTHLETFERFVDGLKQRA